MESLAFLAFGLFALPEDDKRLHMLAGTATAEVARHYGMSPAQACGAALAMGIAKEVLDAQGFGDVDIDDTLATVVGCGVTYRF